MDVAWFNFRYSLLDGLGVDLNWDELRGDPAATCERIRRKLRIAELAVISAGAGYPASGDLRATAMEIDIRNAHNRAIEQKRRRANVQLRRARAGLDAMAIDVTEAEMKRIKAGHGARLAEILTAVAGRLPGLARRKVRSESALAGFRAVNSVHDVPTTRSALEWFAATLATAIGEALVNAHLFRGELGYVDGAGFALGLGGAIALIGIAAGIGWAQLRRPRRSRRLGGFVLFVAALGAAGFFVLGLAHYREALAAQGADAALLARATMAASPFEPLANTTLLPYLIFNLAGFALVCWKSIAMWGFLDLKRLERAADQASRRFEAAKERARADCDAARLQAMDLLDDNLRVAEGNVEQAALANATCQGIRESFRDYALAIADGELACEQHYREVVELVHPSPEPLIRFADPPTRIDIVALEPDEAETTTRMALTARLMKIRDAMPVMTDEIGKATDDAIAQVGKLAAEAEDEARRHPRGKSDNVFSIGK